LLPFHLKLNFLITNRWIEVCPRAFELLYFLKLITAILERHGGIPISKQELTENDTDKQKIELLIKDLEHFVYHYTAKSNDMEHITLLKP